MRLGLIASTTLILAIGWAGHPEARAQTVLERLEKLEKKTEFYTIDSGSHSFSYKNGDKCIYSKISSVTDSFAYIGKIRTGKGNSLMSIWIDGAVKYSGLGPYEAISVGLLDAKKYTSFLQCGTYTWPMNDAGRMSFSAECQYTPRSRAVQKVVVVGHGKDMCDKIKRVRATISFTKMDFLKPE